MLVNDLEAEIIVHNAGPRNVAVPEEAGDIESVDNNNMEMEDNYQRFIKDDCKAHRALL